MRTIPPALAAHLAGDATTLCHCWRVTRRDGVALGFTDHDRDLAFDGTTFAAGSGFEASAGKEEDGLASVASDVKGAFSADAITEADITAGRYDGARVEVFRVNWADVSQRLLVKVQEIGEVSRSGTDFTAELRPFSHRLQQPVGRVYARTCSASLGDKACGLVLQPGIHMGDGAISVVTSESRLALTGFGNFTRDVFAQGALAFLSGPLKGMAVDVAAHAVDGALAVVDLWLPLPSLPVSGDMVRLTAGCDKSFQTCRTRFANGVNFQGFPHLPGPDFAYSYADRDTAHDGGALIP